MVKKWWMIRAGDNNELIPVWTKQGIASIGWPLLGDPKQFQSKDELIEKAAKVYAESKPKSRNSWVNQVWRFSREIKKGDKILTYFKETREYLTGTVTAEHFYDTSYGDPAYPNTIKVNWEETTIARDALSQAAKNSLGSVLTVFRADNWGSEIEKLLNDPYAEPEETDAAEESEIIEDLANKALVMVQDKVDKLDPWQMQELVGGLLIAMGYNAQVSPKGPDGGVDVLAFKDAFGFEKPIIKVQVKHRKSSSPAPDIQQLLGANPMDANSLFVSTGGFTSQAKKVAGHNSVRLVDIEELVNLVVKWYEHMPNDVRALLPLQKIYVPE